VILVDTSIWIDFLSRRPGPGARRLDEVIAAGIPFVMTPIILQEILQGARSEPEFRRLHRSLITQRFIYPIDLTESHVAAAHMYVRCRQRGITPRSAIDCLIAQIAIENQAYLLHKDADFDQLARVVPELRIYNP
jgi:predicted nucleic acid-binding protein